MGSKEGNICLRNKSMAPNEIFWPNVAKRQWHKGALDKGETLVARAVYDNGAMDFP